MKKDFISIAHLDKNIINALFQKAARLKKEFKKKKFINLLKGKIAALLFEKPSLRTRVTFEVAMKQMGGDSIYLSPADVGLGKRESVADVARNLSKWVDLIIVRTFAKEITYELARYSEVPVINALDDFEHPCQVMADYFTISEIKKKSPWQKIKLAWVGDGNNVCHSLILGAGILGVDLAVATPQGYEPKKEVLDKAKEFAKLSGAKITLYNDPKKAIEEKEFIYTDVWVSMGQEAETEKKKKDFEGFQINNSLLNYAHKDYKVMHCLPAHRGEEITDEILDGPNSIVLLQAENRLHIQRAIILYLLK